MALQANNAAIWKKKDYNLRAAIITFDILSKCTPPQKKKEKKSEYTCKTVHIMQ